MEKFWFKLYAPDTGGGSQEPQEKPQEPIPAPANTEEKQDDPINIPIEIVEKLEKLKEAEFEKRLAEERKRWEEEKEKEIQERQEKKERELLIQQIKNEKLEEKFKTYGWNIEELKTGDLKKFLKMWIDDKKNKTPIPEGKKIPTEPFELDVDKLTEAFRKIGG